MSIQEHAAPDEDRCCYNATLLPFCHWEAVVCVVKTRRRGVVDISGFWPGRALRKSNDTFDTPLNRCYFKYQFLFSFGLPSR